ncbi:hypothetical protein [Leptolyngbya sp. CCY15150]|uniref:hypothetical protein n=1 Tax=Leptolyngbya sp. CCY15150 TaxID=2767772 RepID=UPI0019528B75|nr:hypothetical protein [Leptolyngbya sp. CCY15150]
MAPKLHSQTTPSVTPPAASGGNGYAPSVPISVYRQLAAELETTKGQLISVSHKNQQLIQHNQQLQQALTSLVQSALMVQPLVGGTAAPSTAAASPPSAPSAPAPSAPTASARPMAEPSSATGQAPSAPDLPSFDAFFTEQTEAPQPAETRQPRSMNGLWLTLVIVVVMLTAFGAGFLVVRPLLQNNGSDR